jgi:hypothetical protein
MCNWLKPKWRGDDAARLRRRPSVPLAGRSTHDRGIGCRARADCASSSTEMDSRCLPVPTPWRARSPPFRDLQVDIVGTGRPVLMIPGLNSAGSTWNSTCAALQPGVQCHVLQLPGFAGTPAIATDHYMEAIRDRVIDYVAAKHLVSRPSNSSAEPSNLF